MSLRKPFVQTINPTQGIPSTFFGRMSAYLYDKHAKRHRARLSGGDDHGRAPELHPVFPTERH
ncbi:MAG: hypothetical protein KA603_00580 [Azonexus sp.]|jgi:hypothetical protein|nr:hypothetical protein [Betaproteobacteria bacterium]MBK8918681.1 hypothetical protein [Betaproteobacteria bacterium]MBP6034614.1 hypothetical protein [Azonexus sp.]MBP6905154.1 hypothetical protein [Azonexus sp.]